MLAKWGVVILALVFNDFEVFSAPANTLKPVASLPKGITGCKRELNISECVQSAFQDVLKLSKDGIPELHIIPIDPLVVPKVTVQFENSLIRGKASVRNLKIVGVTNAVIEKTNFKIFGNITKYKSVIRVPYLRAEGSYKANIFVNNNKMSSRGEFNASMTDIVANIDSAGEIYERDGRSYLRLTKLDCEPTIGDMKVYANGLVPDENLNNALVDLANENWRRSYQSLVSSTRPSWEPFILKYFNDILDYVPWNLLVVEK